MAPTTWQKGADPVCWSLTEQGASSANLVNPCAGSRAVAGELAQLLADGDSGLSSQT